MLTNENVHVNNDVQDRVNQEHCENIGKLGIDIYIYIMNIIYWQHI